MLIRNRWVRPNFEKCGPSEQEIVKRFGFAWVKWLPSNFTDDFSQILDFTEFLGRYLIDVTRTFRLFLEGFNGLGKV